MSEWIAEMEAALDSTIDVYRQARKSNPRDLVVTTIADLAPEDLAPEDLARLMAVAVARLADSADSAKEPTNG